MSIYQEYMEKHNPDFFNLTEEEQVEYKREHCEEIAEDYMIYLYSKISGKKVENMDEIYELELDEEKDAEALYNEALMFGIGKNNFLISAENELDFDDIIPYSKTLHDINEDIRNYEVSLKGDIAKYSREELNKESFMNDISFAYLMAFSIKENTQKVNYIAIQDLETKIKEELKLLTESLIRHKIPYEIDWQTDLERLSETHALAKIKYKTEDERSNYVLHKLKDSFNDYLDEIFLELKEKLKKESKFIFFEEKAIDGFDSQSIFLLGNDNLKNIRLNNWQSDIEKYNSNNEETRGFLKEQITILFNKLRDFIDENYEELMKNYDPEVLDLSIVQEKMAMVQMVNEEDLSPNIEKYADGTVDVVDVLNESQENHDFMTKIFLDITNDYLEEINPKKDEEINPNSYDDSDVLNLFD